jgi:type VI secretion system protein ImpL
LAVELATPCTRSVAGRYPLVRSSSEEMSREEFARTFGAGGLVDGFFQRQLAPYVDTSARPWTFRTDAARGAETTESLQQFQRAQAIRDAFFRDAGRFGLRLEFRLIELDPGIGQFTLDVDGQVLRFRRDARAAQSVQWPGPASPGRVQLQLTPTGAGAASVHAFEGPWALFRLFDHVRVEPGSVPGRALLLFDVEGRKARFEVRSALPLNPVQRQELEQFRCPHQL